ncbi:hypothetical protein [Schinkia azotoformans]|uniref:hypothetical protein n=1 Tax=Schinkia azotoformans TaxID=1454 RepID=UPI002DB8A070|nr:hypothetical protein [Schinkia azotoformans]MEC1697751.1 hypothetical protein [Schinkia azotoformans]
MNISELTYSDFFWCYDKEIADFLRRKGITYITKARRFDTHAVYYQFLRTTELNQRLAEFNEIKSKSKNGEN